MAKVKVTRKNGAHIDNAVEDGGYKHHRNARLHVGNALDLTIVIHRPKHTLQTPIMKNKYGNKNVPSHTIYICIYLCDRSIRGISKC